jgi:hypothetical protein
VPLQRSLPPASPASSILHELLPTYPPVAVHSAASPSDSPLFAPDASHHELHPTIDIAIPPQSLPYIPEKAPTQSCASIDASRLECDVQMKSRKPTIAAGTFLSLFSFSQIYQNVLLPKFTPLSKRAEERQWVATSRAWVDTKVCNWFGHCGPAPLNKAGWTGLDDDQTQTPDSTRGSGSEQEKAKLDDFWRSANTNPEDWSEDEKILREIPGYVLEHAPYIHLFSGEEFWPGDIAEHLIHTTPHLNYTPLQAASDHPNLTNLNKLNSWGRFVYLQSDDNVEDRPPWLGGETNIPSLPDDSNPENWKDWEGRAGGEYREDVDGEEEDWFEVGDGDIMDKGGIRPPPGATTGPVLVPTDTPEGEELVPEATSTWRLELTRRSFGKQVVGGRSDAPVVLIVIEKDDGVVDAFFFFFYSYNLGNKVFNVRFGNHVGDWEHTVVRFQYGEPKAVFFSEHSFGEAYTWDAVEKIGKRVSVHTRSYE